MERPTIKIEDKICAIKELKGKDWRILGEFGENQPQYTDADFIEQHADLISKFYDVTKEDILDKMPLKEVLPASMAIRTYVINTLTEKIAVIEKNSEADKAQ